MSRTSLDELRAAVMAGPPHRRGLLQKLRKDERAGARQLYELCLKQKRAIRTEDTRLDRMFRYEEELFKTGFSRVAGVDEAGRGPLAGPIVAAAVVLRGKVTGLNDSKKLRVEHREALFSELYDGGHDIGVAVISHQYIDTHGLQAANYAAMLQAALQLTPPPDFILVDGFKIPGCAIPHKPIVKGDALSLSIAAASIIAKVVRDRIMRRLDVNYPQYGFSSHKGYCRPSHIAALRAHGPCPIHRRSFAPVAAPQETKWLLNEMPDEENE